MRIKRGVLLRASSILVILLVAFAVSVGAYPITAEKENGDLHILEYTPPTTLTVMGLDFGTLGFTFTFTALTEPVSVTLPITYTWQNGATSIQQVDGISDTASFSWKVVGPQIITVTATNLSGSITATHIITISYPPFDKFAYPEPDIMVSNGSILTYTIVVGGLPGTVVHLYDPLASGLEWYKLITQETLTYTNGALTGTEIIAGSGVGGVMFAVKVNLPDESFISGYAHISNTAYYYYGWETFDLKHSSNVVSHIVYNPSCIHLPVILENY